ncbi:Acetyltransferase (GNAT) domain-containing protein [Sphingomonas palmae]|uniref:Acetyltransferase (GNAT) domain-containing protein n=1 Tax=Sphingomonas palmae TaxID=1855283 RepID=A0A1H7PLX6_9SPHN|nr:Acetyltransferase (GNAT) domain-containing protein [Sphingomonas palmae]
MVDAGGGTRGVSASALKLTVGARTLVSFPRRLVRVAWSLEQVLAGTRPALPLLAQADDGYLVTSVPHTVQLEADGLRFVRQRYTRYYVNLAGGREAWLTALSGQARSGLKRKAKKLAAANGGMLDVRGYRFPEEMAAFHPLARAVSKTTYQERLLGSGLPEDADALIAASRADQARAWLLFLGDAPIAYLWCGADGDTLRYDYVGHDPAHQALSPGSVLMAAALDDLFADRFRWFDFTEGEGQHKRGLASGGVACRDELLLRATIANRAAVMAVGGFDAAMVVAKRWSEAPALKRFAQHVRRA